MMALFAFVLITGWRSKYRGLSLAASLIAIIGVVAIMPGQYQERLLSLTNIFGTDTTGAAESAHGRIDGIVSGLKLFSLRPLTGVGIGSFGRSRYLVEGVGTEAHSLIGQVFGELGIFGVAAFIWFLLTKHRHMKNLLAEYGPGTGRRTSCQLLRRQLRRPFCCCWSRVCRDTTCFDTTGTSLPALSAL